MSETITVYRSINKAELDETTKLNGTDSDTLLATKPGEEINFMLHKGTNWDHSPDNWPRVMSQDNGRQIIVSFEDRVTGNYKTEHLDTLGMWAIPGHFIWATATVSAEIRVKIARIVGINDNTKPIKIIIEKIGEHIGILTSLLEDYSDEIPEKILSGSGNYKVRMWWWMSFFSCMDDAIQECGIPDQTIEADKDALYRIFNKRRQDRVDDTLAGRGEAGFLRTTQEEIDTANNLLRRLIHNLKMSS